MCRRRRHSRTSERAHATRVASHASRLLQFSDLMRMFSEFSKGTTPGFLTQRYVFLGDYVDRCAGNSNLNFRKFEKSMVSRGKQSLEVIMLLFILKIKWPQKVSFRGGTSNLSYLLSWWDQELPYSAVRAPPRQSRVSQHQLRLRLL